MTVLHIIINTEALDASASGFFYQLKWLCLPYSMESESKILKAICILSRITTFHGCFVIDKYVQRIKRIITS